MQKSNRMGRSTKTAAEHTFDQHPHSHILSSSPNHFPLLLFNYPRCKVRITRFKNMTCNAGKESAFHCGGSTAFTSDGVSIGSNMDQATQRLHLGAGNRVSAGKRPVARKEHMPELFRHQPGGGFRGGRCIGSRARKSSVAASGMTIDSRMST